MNILKKYLGLIWMVAGPAAIWFILAVAIREINAKPTIDTKIQWSVFVIIFIPIAIGLSIFGYYGWTGEYEEDKVR